MLVTRAVVPVLVAGLVASAIACGSPSSTEEAVSARVTAQGTDPRIIGGTPSPTAQDATVFIDLGGGYCSGSLIAPNLVLTARHCVSELTGNDDCQTFTSDNDPTKMGIAVGAQASTSRNPTIAAHGMKLFYETNPSGCSYDIALIQLDQDIPGAPIAKLRFTQATTTDVGTAIGYGDADDHSNMTDGRYQRTGIAVTAIGPSSYTYKTLKNKSIPVTVSPGEILTGESTCFGDSGGPLLDAAGLIIGVTSRGVDNFCVDRPTVWSDVFSHLTMIEAAATTAGHPLTPTSTIPDAGTDDADTGTSSSSSSTSSSSGSSGLGTTDTDAATPPSDTTTDTTEKSGCSAAPGRTSGPSGLLAVGLGIVAVLGARRRRR